MQKINREALRDALSRPKFLRTKRHEDIINNAAAILLEITGEDWVPTKEMYDNCYNELRQTAASLRPPAYHIIKPMLRELVE